MELEFCTVEMLAIGEVLSYRSFGCGMWRRAIWYEFTDISDECAASFFMVMEWNE
jgi:hypothetical protein